MHYDRQEENEKAKSFVKELSRNMKPNDAILVDALKENPQHASGEHYTFSCYLPANLREQLRPITEKLREIDPTLILNDPEFYHLTVFWCQMDKNAEKLAGIFRDSIAKKPLEFELHGLVALPFGISLKAYPTNDNFFRLRETLYAEVDQALPLNDDGTLHERAVSTWITLGRYTTAPSKKLQQYINQNADLDFGVYMPEDISLYISNNKYLYQPEIITTMVNGPSERSEVAKQAQS